MVSGPGGQGGCFCVAIGPDTDGDGAERTENRESQRSFSVKKNQTHFLQRLTFVPALALSGSFMKGRRETVNCVLSGAEPQARGLCMHDSHGLLRVLPASH